MPRDPVDDLRELERRDGELQAEADRLRSLDAEVAAVRARAEEIDAFFAAYPDEDTRLREAVASARQELDARRGEEAAARAELERAHDDEDRRIAERALERAVDHVSAAAARVERSRAAHDALEREAAALPEELAGLEARAHAVAAGVAEVPPPGDGPRPLVEWASRAHASIFVSAGSLDTQRDRVIREANELATALLGEATYGSTVAQVTARVEAARSR